MDTFNAALPPDGSSPIGIQHSSEGKAIDPSRTSSIIVLKEDRAAFFVIGGLFFSVIIALGFYFFVQSRRQRSHNSKSLDLEDGPPEESKESILLPASVAFPESFNKLTESEISQPTTSKSNLVSHFSPEIKRSRPWTFVKNSSNFSNHRKIISARVTDSISSFTISDYLALHSPLATKPVGLSTMQTYQPKKLPAVYSRVRDSEPLVFKQRSRERETRSEERKDRHRVSSGSWSVLSTTASTDSSLCLLSPRSAFSLRPPPINQVSRIVTVDSQDQNMDADADAYRAALG